MNRTFGFAFLLLLLVVIYCAQWIYPYIYAKFSKTINTSDQLIQYTFVLENILSADTFLYRQVPSTNIGVMKLIGITAVQGNEEDVKSLVSELRKEYPYRSCEYDVVRYDLNNNDLVYIWLNNFDDEILLNEVLIEKGYAVYRPSPINSKYNERLHKAQQRANVKETQNAFDDLSWSPKDMLMPAHGIGR